VLERAGGEPLAAELERLKPAELLVARTRQATEPGGAARPRRATLRPPWHFDATARRGTWRRLALLTDSSARGPRGFGAAICRWRCARPARCCSTCATRRRRRCRISARSAWRIASDALQIDAATRRNLELDRSLGATSDATLFGAARPRATAMGSARAAALAEPAAARRATPARRYAALVRPGERALRTAVPKRCRRSAISSASWRASRCARRGRATWRSCARRSPHCRRCGDAARRSTRRCCDALHNRIGDHADTNTRCWRARSRSPRRSCATAA
jgi:hypothetical protein